MSTLDILKRENSDVFYSDKFLEYSMKTLLWQKWATQIKMPKKSGKTITVQSWNPPAKVLAPVPLVEGVTPDSKQISKREVATQLVWYGNFLQHTDLVETILEDADNLMDAENEYLGTLQAEERDMAMFNILLGGTNVIYANGAATRNLIDTPMSIGDLHISSRTLKNGLDGRSGKPVSKQMKSDGRFGTVDIEPSYIAVISPDLEYDVRSLPGFAPVSSYGSPESVIHMEEFGKVDNFRFICTTHYKYFAAAGGAVAGKNIEGTVSADVYPVIILAQDAYATVPLIGEMGASLIRKDLGSSGGLDPLNQRATVGYKNPFAGLITFQERMVRLEVAVSNRQGM